MHSTELVLVSFIEWETDRRLIITNEMVLLSFIESKFEKEKIFSTWCFMKF